MNKLLTEQGLRDFIKKYGDGLTIKGAEYISDSELINLIESQKHAHGEMVIGEDIDIPAEMEKVGRNFAELERIATIGELINGNHAIQRERNKS